MISTVINNSTPLLLQMALSNQEIIFIVVATITTAILFQLTRIIASKKQQRQSSGLFNVCPENYTKEELEENDAELKQKHHNDIMVYCSNYLLPTLFALPAYLIFFNIAIGLSFFIAGIVAIVLSVIITKK